MKKILLSLATLGVVGVVAIGATTAIFSDTESSTGNTFTAGAIDLQIDNDSYYNGERNVGTSWIQKDLEEGDFFFNFDDLKPGDWGEDTISINVNNNDSYVCADVTLTSNDDNGSTEPELNDEDPYTSEEGELVDRVKFIAWADDGDNVLEADEQVYELGTFGALNVGDTVTAALADSQTNIWDDEGPLPGNTTKYIGKAWCFGALDVSASTYVQDGLGADDENKSGPDVRPIICDGAPEDNSTQTDSMTADISFRAVQSRNNGDFVCQAPKDDRATITVTKVVEGGQLAIGDFDLFVSGEPVESGVSEAVAADTLLTVTENDDSGFYTAEFSGECNASGEISISAGESGSCTITNTYDPVSLTVNKILTVSSDSISVEDFTLHISGPGVELDVTDEVATTGLPAGTYTVTEEVTGNVGGATFTTVFGGACTDNAGVSGSVTIENGETPTCTITNTEVIS